MGNTASLAAMAGLAALHVIRVAYRWQLRRAAAAGAGETPAKALAVALVREVCFSEDVELSARPAHESEHTLLGAFAAANIGMDLLFVYDGLHVAGWPWEPMSRSPAVSCILFLCLADLWVADHVKRSMRSGGLSAPLLRWLAGRMHLAVARQILALMRGD